MALGAGGDVECSFDSSELGWRKTERDPHTPRGFADAARPVEDGDDVGKTFATGAELSHASAFYLQRGRAKTGPLSPRARDPEAAWIRIRIRSVRLEPGKDPMDGIATYGRERRLS